MTIDSLAREPHPLHGFEVDLDLIRLRDRSLRAYLTEDNVVTAGRILTGAIRSNMAIADAFWQDPDYQTEASVGLVEDLQDLDALLAATEMFDDLGFEILLYASIEITMHLLQRAHWFGLDDECTWEELAAQSAPTVSLRESTLVTLVAFAKDPELPSMDLLPRRAGTFHAMTALCSAALAMIAELHEANVADVLTFEAECLELAPDELAAMKWETLRRGYLRGA